MIESLRLFRSVCNSRWFYNTAMILFLNKKDIFEEKIKTTSIQCLFKNYMDPMIGLDGCTVGCASVCPLSMMALLSNEFFHSVNVYNNGLAVNKLASESHQCILPAYQISENEND
uniref:Uncharacterized protein n=1 Tax=Meloidogyne incognita TaxID=6306 RepID=A0A914N4T5_MELIC